MNAETGTARWGRYRAALDGEGLPAALVDLDAVDTNLARLMAAAAGKPIRLATKSIRCPALIRYLVERGAGAIRGLMTYSAAETAFLAAEGYRDLLLAYPTAHPRDAALLAEAGAGGASVAAVADDEAHLGVLERAARERSTRLHIVVEIDLAYRLFGAHLGVWRSPLATVDAVCEFAARIAHFPHLAFYGLLGYEAQIAGLTDDGPFSAWQNPARRFLKRRSRVDVARRRAEVVAALGARGLAPQLVNGGGTGSLAWSAAESALTEVTAGSGFLDSHLFDSYRALDLEPAAYFALQVVRRPAPGIVTCHGGGYVASGGAGPDRLPLPSLPAGLRLLDLEGAGEVQTPLRVPPEVQLALGDPVFFRHAKAGELAEHFNEYLLVRGDQSESRAKTYRGLGHSFLG